MAIVNSVQFFIQSVNSAGLLGVQNILSADTGIPGKLKVIHSVIT
jgi:hypothetical protein